MGEPVQNLTLQREKFEKAAEYHWNTLGVTWEDVAKFMGVKRQTIYEWRKTELWEITYKEVARRGIDRLASFAVHGLKRAWAEGKGTGAAVEVLRSEGLLSNETVNLRTTLEEPRNALKEFMDERSAHRLRSRDVAESPPDIP